MICDILLIKENGWQVTGNRLLITGVWGDYTVEMNKEICYWKWQKPVTDDWQQMRHERWHMIDDIFQLTFEWWLITDNR